MQPNLRVRVRAVLSTLLLYAVSLFFLPSALLALFYNYAALALIPQNKLRRQIRRSTRFRPQTIAISGVSSPQGLRLARAFYQTGHRVVGIDNTLFGAARFSRALVRTYAVPTPKHEDQTSGYIKGVLSVVRREKATMWIDCTEGTPGTLQAQARAIIELKTDCACLATDAKLVDKFSSRQSFLGTVKGLGLPTIETHRVQSRTDIHNILNGSRGKKFILSSTNGSTTPPKQAILPRRTLSQTYNEVSRLKVTPSDVWTLEQHMEGQPKYTAVSLVIRGEVKLFIVCCKLESQGGLHLVPPTSGLSQATRTYVDDVLKQLDTSFSSHLCLDFYVAEKPAKSGVTQQILPINGTLSSSPPIVLCAGKQGSIDLTRAYLSLLEPSTTVLGSFTGLPYNESSANVVVPRDSDIGLYSFGGDLSALTNSLFRTITRQTTILSFCKLFVSVLSHIVSYREALYEFWDPLPAFWYAFVLAPQANSLISESDLLVAPDNHHLVSVNGS